MTAPADLVRDSAAQLPGYVARLEEHLAEPSAAGYTDALSPRHPDAPFPGNAAAFSVLMVIWEAVPRLEARLRLEVAGHPGQRRGGSARNFLAALEAIVAQSGGVDEDLEAWAARTLERLCNLARAIPDIDEAERWRLITGYPCPYCGCYAVRVQVDSRCLPTRRVECFSGPRSTGERCVDGNGRRPVAEMTIDGLIGADGTVWATPDLDAA